MKSLLKYLSPFAPDQSGAVSVLFECGGMIVICDAGGCTGNICGFDEPRWFTRKSALFSAGLRDMDAILGRDDKLAEKLQLACTGSPFLFAALIGTPVPAIIATDFRALKRMVEKRTGLPVLALENTGTNLYDKGEEAAYLALFRQFAQEGTPEKGTVGVLGATPLDLSTPESTAIVSKLRAEGWKNVICHGMGSGMDGVKNAASAEKNLVLAPAAVKTAKYLEEKFGTPWEVWTPAFAPDFREQLSALEGRKVLVIHQQFMANAVRDFINANTSSRAVSGSFFMMLPDWKQEGDLSFAGEEAFTDAVEQGGFDTVIGDLKLKRPLRNFKGTFIDLPHFAVSGRFSGE